MASVAQAIAATTAVACATRRPSYRPVALFFAVATVANLAHFIIVPHVRSRSGASLEGWTRALAHVDLAIYFLYDFGLAAVALWLFGASERVKCRGIALATVAWLREALLREQTGG